MDLFFVTTQTQSVARVQLLACQLGYLAMLYSFTFFVRSFVSIVPEKPYRGSDQLRYLFLFIYFPEGCRPEEYKFITDKKYAAIFRFPLFKRETWGFALLIFL